MRDMYNSNLLVYNKLCDNASEYMPTLRSSSAYSALVVDYRCIQVILTKRMKTEVK